MIIMLGIVSFSIVSGAISWAIGRRAVSSDARETSLSVLLASWMGLLFGMYITRFL